MSTSSVRALYLKRTFLSATVYGFITSLTRSIARGLYDVGLPYVASDRSTEGAVDSHSGSTLYSLFIAHPVITVRASHTRWYGVAEMNNRFTRFFGICRMTFVRDEPSFFSA